MKDVATVILLILIISMYGYALGVAAKALIDINKDKRKDDK